MSNKIIAAYIRISTDKKQKVDSQVADIEEYCENHSLEPKFYIDEGFTGNNVDRLAFLRLQEDVFKGRVSTIIVSRLDRISRKAGDGINIFEGWLEKDINVISVNESMSFEGAAGKLTRQLLQILSEWDSSQRRERALKGIQVAREKHPEKFSGRKTGAYSIDVEKIHKLRAMNFSIESIAKTLNVGKTSVQNHIDRKAAFDVTTALNVMAKKSDLTGVFNIEYDFNTGLSGTFTVKGLKPEEIPNRFLSDMMKASKKWYAKYYHNNRELYESALTELASVWYEEVWSSFNYDESEPEEISLGTLMKEAVSKVSARIRKKF